MKKIFQSRTIWLAIIQAFASILIAVFTELDMVSYVLFTKSVVDIIIRLDTDKGIQ